MTPDCWQNQISTVLKKLYTEILYEDFNDTPCPKILTAAKSLQELHEEAAHNNQNILMNKYSPLQLLPCSTNWSALTRMLCPHSCIVWLLSTIQGKHCSGQITFLCAISLYFSFNKFYASNLTAIWWLRLNWKNNKLKRACIHTLLE